MKGAKIYLVLLIGAFMLVGCSAFSPDDAAVQSVSTTSQQSVVGAQSSSAAIVTDITKKAVPDNPGVTRVVLTLDKKASYSTSREGNRLIINVFSATMKSSIKQLDVQDPVIKSITAKQVGKSVKSIVELVNQDVAYRPSTATNPFQILIDVWQISPKTAMQQTSPGTGQATVPAPVKSLKTEGQRTREVTVDLQETSSGVALSPTPPTGDVPAQLEWFSEKLSQVLQERERLKQSLLESEKSFAVKDSMIQVLERKVKEANTRIVELEEELIKMRSKTSLAEQNEQALQQEISQLLAQLEQTTGTQLAPEEVSQPGQVRTRSEQLLERISVARQKTQTELESLQSQIEMLSQERDDLQEQVDTCSAEVASLRQTTSQLAAIEQQLKVKEVEFARLRQAIGAAAQLVTGSPVVTTPRAVQPEIQATAPEVSAAEQPSSSQVAVDTTSPGVTQQDDQLILADLIHQAELLSLDNAAEYVLGPGDVISIKVLKEENLDKTVTVSSDGFITYPLLGDLRVDGLTTGQLDAQITSLLARDYLVDPEVIIEVVKQRSKKVYIMGMVKQPGYHEIQGDQRLLGTLLNAGGPSSFDTEARVLRLPKEPGDEPTDTLSPIIVDLQKLFVDGDQTQNILLRDGDVLMVSQKTSAGVSVDGMSMGPNQFYVVGSVTNPGVYTYQANDTVLDAILRAGGFTEFASMNGTKVVRESDGKTRTFRVKMKDVMEKGDMDKNIDILPGDMIIIPESFF